MHNQNVVLPSERGEDWVTEGNEVLVFIGKRKHMSLGNHIASRFPQFASNPTWEGLGIELLAVGESRTSLQNWARATVVKVEGEVLFLRFHEPVLPSGQTMTVSRFAPLILRADEHESLRWDTGDYFQRIQKEGVLEQTASLMARTL